jgi:hypothetical protein
VAIAWRIIMEREFTERRRFLKSSFMVGLATGIAITHGVYKLVDHLEEEKEEKKERKCPPVLANDAEIVDN